MGRLAKGSPKLGAEMGARQSGLARQVADIERLRVVRVDEILGAQQVAGRVRGCHRSDGDGVGGLHVLQYREFGRVGSRANEPVPQQYGSWRDTSWLKQPSGAASASMSWAGS